MRSILLSVIALLLLFLGADGNAVEKKAKKPKQDAQNSKLPSKTSQVTEIGGKTLDQWLKDLKSTDPGVFENAVRTIVLFGPRANAAIPIVLGKLKKDTYYLDVSVKVNVAIFLGIIGLEDQELEQGVKGLTHLLNDSQAIVKLHAAIALGRIGREANASQKTMLFRLGDTNSLTSSWEIRKACAMALARVAMPPDNKTPPDVQVIGKLSDRLGKETCSQVRLEIAQTLVILGPPASGKVRNDAIQTLARVANKKTEDKAVRIWAHVAGMRMSMIDRTSKIDQKGLTFIGDQLDDPVLGVRCQAARALGIIGPEAKTQVRKLKSALRDKDGLMLTWVLYALAGMGQSAASVIPTLKDMARNTDDKGLKEAIANTIKIITGKPNKGKPILEQRKLKNIKDRAGKIREQE